jgi:PAS domain S-box-containing protein
MEGDPPIAREEIFQQISEGVLLVDSDGVITYADGRAADLFDREPAAIRDEPLFEAIPAVRGTNAGAVISRAIENGHDRPRSMAIETDAGELELRLHPLEAGLSIYLQPTQKPTGPDGSQATINSTLRSLIEKSSQAVYIKDAQRRYQYANSTICEQFGLDRDTIIGNREEELFDVDIVKAIRELDTRVLEEGVTVQQELSQCVDDEPQHFLDHKYPVLDESGAVVGIMGIGVDITERKRNEQELRQLTSEYEAIFENAADSIFLFDVDRTGEEIQFRYVRVNPAHEAVAGLDSAAVRGKTPVEVLGPEVGNQVTENYRRCVEQEAPLTYKEELTVPEGRKHWQTKLAPVIVDGAVTRLVGITRDITDQVERERELRQQNERLDEFAEVISHDLRNPLTVAQGRLEVVADDVEDRHLEAMETALVRMEAIIEDTLTLAKNGAMVAETEPLAFAEVVGRCWRLVETGGADLEIEDTFTVHADEDRLQHVFENLFRNAVEHAGDDVTIRVGRYGPDGVYVADDGPGVDPADREDIFDAGSSSTTDGTGLGLAIVSRIAKAHDWEVRCVESDAGGARFELKNVPIE